MNIISKIDNYLLLCEANKEDSFIEWLVTADKLLQESPFKKTFEAYIKHIMNKKLNICSFNFFYLKDNFDLKTSEGNIVYQIIQGMREDLANLKEGTYEYNEDEFYSQESAFYDHYCGDYASWPDEIKNKVLAKISKNNIEQNKSVPPITQIVDKPLCPKHYSGYGDCIGPPHCMKPSNFDPRDVHVPSKNKKFVISYIMKRLINKYSMFEYDYDLFSWICSVDEHISYLLDHDSQFKDIRHNASKLFNMYKFDICNLVIFNRVKHDFEWNKRHCKDSNHLNNMAKKYAVVILTDLNLELGHCIFKSFTRQQLLNYDKRYNKTIPSTWPISLVNDLRSQEMVDDFTDKQIEKEPIDNNLQHDNKTVNESKLCRKCYDGEGKHTCGKVDVPKSHHKGHKVLIGLRNIDKLLEKYS